MTQELHLTSKVKLAREDFFFVAEGSYDDWADRAILSYSEVQDAVSRSLRFADKQAVHIADLGAVRALRQPRSCHICHTPVSRPSSCLTRCSTQPRIA